MKFSTPCLVTAVLLQQLVTSVAFAPKLPIRSALSMTGSPTTIVSMAEDEPMQLVDDTSAVPVESDTHDELMYALGVNLARQLGDIRPLVENGEELAQVAKGLLDTVVGRLNEDGQTAILRKRGTELNKMIADRANSLREKLEQRGREMLANMAETEGVTTLDNGVVLHVLEAAPGGQRPTTSSTVLIHYHGTLADGNVFDSTLGGDAAKFPLAQVIPGWRDGVLKMHEGETAMLGIPPEEAYGEEGTPDGRIPGGSTLFFKVQLVEVMSAGIGGEPTLLGADGNRLDKGDSGLVGADGKPL
jgi:FKBP-type peptidyl-prolyl cis-trans isomerase